MDNINTMSIEELRVLDGLLRKLAFKYQGSELRENLNEYQQDVLENAALITANLLEDLK